MLLDPAISGAIAADRVAWMALAKFNTGGRAIRASGTTRLYPHLSQLTTTTHRPGAELHTADHTTHHMAKTKTKTKTTDVSFPTYRHPNISNQSMFSIFLLPLCTQLVMLQLQYKVLMWYTQKFAAVHLRERLMAT